MSAAHHDELTANNAPADDAGRAPTVMNPVPMSFPATLRNPKLLGRLAQIREDSAHPAVTAHPKKRSRDDRDGKRWIRRQENARFIHNPHIVQASKHDYSLEPPSTRSTFPVPLPPYLPRGVAAPSTRLPAPDAASANSGRFSLGLKGMRRDLRRNGARAERLVKEIETELVEWLVGGTILLPDRENGDEVSFPGRAIGTYASEETGKENPEREGIWEVSRTPLQLVWAIENDAFTRYVAHCCARYHSVVSFSKDVLNRRLTYFLRPNVTRPDHFARAALDTPPATDYSSHASAISSGVDSDSASIASIKADAVLEESEGEDADVIMRQDGETRAHSNAEALRLSQVPILGGTFRSDENANANDDDDRTPRPRARFHRKSPRLRTSDSSPAVEADDELVLSENMQHIHLDSGFGTPASYTPTRNSTRNDLEVHADTLSTRLRPTLQPTVLWDSFRRRTSSPSGSRSPRRPFRAEWSRLRKRRKQDGGGRPQTLYDYLYF